MEETKLLIFRWGNKKYGIPVEDVSGIISNAGPNGLSIFEKVKKPIHLQGEPVLGCNGEARKSAIITHATGVQILIIVDEVLEESKMMNLDSQLGATVVPLQIWKFKNEVGSIE